MNMKRMAILFPVLIFAALLLLHPETVSQAVRDGLQLCAGSVIPSLFPFFVVVSLLLQLGAAEWIAPLFAPLMGPLFRLRGQCALPLLTGLLGGYPTGAKTVWELYQQRQISRTEAELLLGFCNNCGCAFLLSFVGGTVLGSTAAGARLFAIHAVSALLSGWLLCRLPRHGEPPLLPVTLPAKQSSFPQALTGAISSALTSVGGICAFVTFFRVGTDLLPPLFPLRFAGILEMVSGLSALTPDRLGFILAAGITGWGGLCVHCQAMAAAPGLSFRRHLMGKALQAVISVLLALAVSG